MDGVIQLNINKKVLHTSSMVLVGNRLVSFVALFAWHMEPALVVTEELLSSIPVFIQRWLLHERPREMFGCTDIGESPPYGTACIVRKQAVPIFVLVCRL